MKYAYVLVSDEADYFYEMLYLSLVCLSRYCDDGQIIVVVDELTSNSLISRKLDINKYLNSLIVVSVDEEKYKSKSQRSRFLKTSLRNLIDGDYLYIDLDAFPMGSFSNMFKNSSLSMAYDMNSNDRFQALERHELEIFEAMNWAIPTKEFYNSGVMWVSDNVENRALFKEWHSLWNKSTEAGFMKDQPALHQALRNLNISVDRMSPNLNILLNIPPNHKIRDPFIFHMSTIRFEERVDTLFHHLVKSLKYAGVIDYSDLDYIRRHKYPWMSRESIRLAWYSGDYKLLVKNIFHKIFGIFLGK